MKLWKRWTAAALAAAMALLLLAACGPSGPSAPDAPDKPGTGETGKEPTEGMTEEQKKAAVVEALNTVRKDYGNNTPLTMDAEVCAMAEKMAKLQLDWLLGEYSNDPNGKRYTKDWNDISQLPVKGKKLVGVGGYGGDPTESVIRGWAEKGSDQKKALVRDESATLVGVGVVQNTDEKTKDKYPIMVVVMTY
jgi:predicted small lipoprotein YifL